MYMKLYANPADFTWGTVLPILDRPDHPRFFLLADTYTLRRQITISDLSHRTAVLIRQDILSLFPRFELEIYGKPTAAVQRSCPDSPSHYTISPLNWEVTDYSGPSSYRITCAGTPVAACCPWEQADQSFVAWEIQDRTLLLPALGVMALISCVIPR